MDQLKKPLSRRRFLQATAATAGAAALSGALPAARMLAQDGPTGRFNWMTWTDHFYQEQRDEIEAAIGISARVTELADNADGFTRLKEVGGQLDMISGEYVARNIACMAESARHCTIALMGGAKATIPMHKVMTKRLMLTGSTLRPRSDRFKAGVAQELDREVWPFVTSGQLRAEMDSRFPLERADDAHRRLEEGGHIGKIVLIAE